MFPYLPCDRDLTVTCVALLYETAESRELVCCKGEYVCCDDPRSEARPCKCGAEGGHTRHRDAYACRDCEAACCCECIRACHTIEYRTHCDHEDDGWDDDEEAEMRCVVSDEYPGLYHGIAHTRLGPIEDRGADLTFEFPGTVGRIRRAFLMCYYEVARACGDEDDRQPAHRTRPDRG